MSTAALILAAGNGSRLRAAIGPRSKCLADIDGAPLIVRQLDALAGAGVDDVTVVVGYDCDEVRAVVGRRAVFVHNDHFATTNSLASYLLAAPTLGGDVLVLNCDVLCSPAVIERMEGVGASVVAFDSTSGSDPEHMKVAVGPDGSLRAMSKTMAAAAVSGENLGLLRFDAATAAAVAAAGSALMARGRRTAWLAEAVEAAAGSCRLACLDVAGSPWVEIDFPEDLDRARYVVWPALVGLASGNHTRMEPAHV